MRLCPFKESFGKQPGFSRSESRTYFSYEIFRRFDPIQSSLKFGRDYESWMFRSVASHLMTQYLLTVPGVADISYPSRIDLTYDFECPSEYYPASFIDDHRSKIKERRLEVHTAGPEFIGTRYIGSRKSDDYVRIYRKDLEDDSYKKPVLRIELEIKGDRAKLYWSEACTFGLERVMRGGSAAFWVKTGFELLPDSLEMPSCPPSKVAPFADSFCSMLYQYGPILFAADRAGIDLAGFAQYRVENSSRNTKWRFDQKCRELDGLDLADLCSQIMARLDRG